MKSLANKEAGCGGTQSKRQRQRPERMMTSQRGNPEVECDVTGRSSELVANNKAADPHANRLLGLLPPRDYARLRPHLHRISLEYRQSLYRANAPIGFVYFIQTGVARW